MSENKCIYCNDPNFVRINKTVEYSGVEICVNGKVKVIRVRVYPELSYKGTFDYMDMANINYCPMCGRKLDE